MQTRQDTGKGLNVDHPSENNFDLKTGSCMELSSHQEAMFQNDNEQMTPSIRISRESDYKLPPVDEWREQQENNQNNKMLVQQVNNPLMPQATDPPMKEGEVWYDSRSDFPVDNQQHVQSVQISENTIFPDGENTTATITISADASDAIRPISTAVTLNPLGTTTAKPMTGIGMYIDYYWYITSVKNIILHSTKNNIRISFSRHTD